MNTIYADYTLNLRDPRGNLLTTVSNWTNFEMSRAVNGVGACTVTAPEVTDAVRNVIDEFSKFNIDGTLEVWRTVGKKRYLEGNTVFFFKRRKRSLTSSGDRTFTLYGVDANELISRRHVMYAAGSTQAQKTAAADNMMKAIVRENLGSSAAPATRIFNGVSVQNDVTLGPVIDKSFAWRPCLTVLQEIAAEAVQNGTYVAFDMVPLSFAGRTFEFRTFIGQLGKDRRRSSGNGFILSPEFGNVDQAEYDEDWTGSASAILVAGQNQASQRFTSLATSPSRIATSDYGYIEHFVDGRNVTGTDLGDEAIAELRLARPKILMTAHLIQTDGSRFGINYGFGDYLTVQFVDLSFDARLDSYKIQVRDGREDINVILRSEI